MGTLTVGKLTKQGHHTLSRKDIYQHILENEKKKEGEKQALDTRKHIVHIKFKTRVQEGIKRYRTNKKLRFDDIKALLKQYHQPGDSPIRKLMPEAKFQWEKKMHSTSRSRTLHV